MIDRSIEFGSPHAHHVPASLLVDDVARLCVAAGIDLCAVYPVQGSGAPIAFERASAVGPAPLAKPGAYQSFLDSAARFGLSLHREAISVDGDERVWVIFGTRAGRELDPSLVRSACALFSSAIAQAERLAHYHRVSDRLQRALLPAALADAPGITFDAAYSPAGSEAEVGGDWYDAFEIGNGLICISVGDVTGHGLEAAVTMSEMRRAIRTSAAAHDSPTAILDTVDAIATSQSIGIASAIVGLFDPKTNLLRYSSAGHPPPIFVTAKGRAYTIPGGGTLLGLGLGSASTEHAATLSSGASVVLYTDGLTEYDRDIFTGEKRLIEALESLAVGDGIKGDALHARILAGGARDDCATLVASSVTHAARARECYTVSAVPTSARLLRDAIRDYADRAGIVGEQQYAAIVASGEAIANAIEHGEQEAGTAMTVEVATEGGALRIEVESRGHWRSSSSENRGRGISIMRAYASSLELSSTSERTRVCLTFTADGTTARPA